MLRRQAARAPLRKRRYARVPVGQEHRAVGIACAARYLTEVSERRVVARRREAEIPSALGVRPPVSPVLVPGRLARPVPRKLVVLALEYHCWIRGREVRRPGLKEKSLIVLKFCRERRDEPAEVHLAAVVAVEHFQHLPTAVALHAGQLEKAANGAILRPVFVSDLVAARVRSTPTCLGSAERTCAREKRAWGPRRSPAPRPRRPGG